MKRDIQSMAWQRAAHALRDAGAALFNQEDNAEVRWIAATLLYEEARDQMIDPQVWLESEQGS